MLVVDRDSRPSVEAATRVVLGVVSDARFLAGWAAQAAEFAKEQEAMYQQMADAGTDGAWDMLTDEQLNSVFSFAMDDGKFPLAIGLLIPESHS